MDYEKKYKDLYSRLKKVFDTTQSQEVIDMLYDNFREELYESEDEKIRKELLCHIQGEIDTYNNMVSGDYDSRDKEDKKVELYDGTLLPYDVLCVAAGSYPVVPRFDGLDTVGKQFSFTTLDDALSLEKAVDQSSKVLIVGAGMIGLKCAECLAEKVSEITVCDLADHVLPTFLDFECASYVQKRLEDHGIRFALGDSVEHFGKDPSQQCFQVSQYSGRKIL